MMYIDRQIVFYLLYMYVYNRNNLFYIKTKVVRYVDVACCIVSVGMFAFYFFVFFNKNFQLHLNLKPCFSCS